MSDHRTGVELMAGDQTNQCWCGVDVHQTGGDGEVLAPDVLEMQCRGCAVHADVRHMPAGMHEFDCLLESFGKPDRLHSNVGAELACLQSGFSDVDRHNVAATVQPCCQNRR